jgi:hypothetical protein
MSSWWNEWQGKPKYLEKTFPIAALSTTNPATDRLSYSTAHHFDIVLYMYTERFSQLHSIHQKAFVSGRAQTNRTTGSLCTNLVLENHLELG